MAFGSQADPVEGRGSLLCLTVRSPARGTLLACAALVLAACGPGEQSDGIARPTLGVTFVEGCDRFTIGEEFGPLVAAYGVELGELTDPCFGSAHATVEQAWDDLVDITPARLIESITVVAGYEANESGTIAFATPINDDTEAFLIAVDVETGQENRDEMRLTMAHELAHVFTQTSDQIDVAVYADECDTFFNGFGCFQPDAYVTAWVDEFWTPERLLSLPSDGEIDELGGDDRCTLDPSFPGSYAASHPEEDFAETFAAYVYGIELPAAVQPRLRFFDAYPDFVEMRSHALAAGLHTLPNNFDLCG